MSRGFAGGAVAFGVMLIWSGLASAADAPKQVTFSKDVAPILQAKCQDCHQPNSIAPMSLITFQEARPWARSIKDRVGARQMPPWHIDRSVGVQKFKNDMSLTDEQIDTIVQMGRSGRAAGRPEGHAAGQAARHRQRVAGGEDGYGPPDLVVKSLRVHDAGRASGHLVAADERHPAHRAALGQDGGDSAVQSKARKIIHHSIAYLVLNNDPRGGEHRHRRRLRRRRRQMPTTLVNRRPQLMEWAIGKGYDLLSARAPASCSCPARRSPGISTFMRSAKRSRGGSEIGLWFYPKGQEPKHRSYLVGVHGHPPQPEPALDIPPNSIAHTEGFTVLKENTLITNFQPHFHLRGKAMQVEAILPDGSTQIISYVANFNFNWMTNYIYADDAAPAFPKGTIIHVSAFYDNTKANKNNPDPDQWVGYGDRTVDEMAHAWMNVVYLSDAEYQAAGSRSTRPSPRRRRTQQ